MTTPPITDLNTPDLFHVRIKPKGGTPVTSWTLIEWRDPSLCGCTEHLCVSCAQSWGWDHDIWWPAPVRVTPAITRLIRARRESHGFTWVQLAALVGAPLGTISSLGYAPQRLTARVFRGLAHALQLTTRELLDGIGG